jgi:hypothetical protein
MADLECDICGRRGYGVRPWGVVMPAGTVVKLTLCSGDAEPLKKLARVGNRERRHIGTSGLDALVEDS